MTAADIGRVSNIRKHRPYLGCSPKRRGDSCQYAALRCVSLAPLQRGIVPVKTRCLLFYFAVLLLTACSTTEVVQTWKDDSQNQKFSNVLVVTVSKVPSYRARVEHQLVNIIEMTGAVAKAAVDILPNTELIDEAAASAATKDTGADAVMVVRVVETKKEELYTPGTTYLKGGYGDKYNISWHEYYGGGYRAAPGYSRKFSVSTVETTLFDTTINKPVWSALTEITEATEGAAINAYLEVISKPIKESGLFE